MVNLFKLLGCIFDSELENLAENFTKVLTAIRKELYAWSSRKLSIKGKITVIKTYALSKLNHLVVILPTLNRSFINDLENLLFKFIDPGSTVYPNKIIC